MAWSRDRDEAGVSFEDDDNDDDDIAKGAAAAAESTRLAKRGKIDGVEQCKCNGNALVRSSRSLSVFGFFAG